MLNDESLQVINEIIGRARKLVSVSELNRKSIDKLSKNLSDAGFSCKKKKYPSFDVPLVDRAKSNAEPVSLAEAFIWKLERWQAFKAFESMCLNCNVKPEQSQIVVFAFSEYIKMGGVPIFDQHVLRAARYIFPWLSKNKKDVIDKALLTKTTSWSKVMSGAEGEAVIVFCGIITFSRLFVGWGIICTVLIWLLIQSVYI